MKSPPNFMYWNMLSTATHIVLETWRICESKDLVFRDKLPWDLSGAKLSKFILMIKVFLPTFSKEVFLTSVVFSTQWLELNKYKK